MTRKRMSVVMLALFLLTLTAGCGTARLTMMTPAEDRPLTRAESPDNRLALTFDVTWEKRELGKILAILQTADVKATFFVGGTFLGLHGDVVRHMGEQGHEVGTLGQKIVNLSQLPETEVTSNLLASQSALSKMLGGPVRYFRPPQGDATPAIVAAARQANLTTVTHSLDSEDHLGLKASTITKRVVGRARKGDIVRLSASDWSPETARALPGIIQGLRERGFALVKVSELVPQQ
ncbi:MAG TPA: polysaccharide deacetylase family protein [Symbiobacteriaceae bacterium]|nr:polysaccharide deacetylase family protein [Symbiobacteriaceae bacterium]